MDSGRNFRRKLLCIHHGTGIGGASLELLYLLQKLNRKVFDLKVLCVHDSEATELFKNNRIDVRVLNGWRCFSHSEVYWVKWNRPDLVLLDSISWLIIAWRYGRRILREEKPDLLYLNSTPLSAWAIAAKALNIPVVCHVREPLAQGYFGIRKSLLRSVLKKNVDRFIAVSAQNARTLDVPSQTQVIYGFVHIDQFNPSIAAAEIPQIAGNRRKIALYLGGAALIKGFRVMVDALDYLEPGILVLFGGYYPNGRSWKDPLRKVFKPNLARAYRKLSSAPNALMIGVRTDVPQWIAACDVLVAPFTVPHFARPVVEAAAMAKPAIASDVEGMEELVVDGRTGVLVPVGDAKALADAINRVCADERLAANMGKAGYQRVRALFEGETNTKNTFEVFHELLRDPKKAKGMAINGGIQKT